MLIKACAAGAGVGRRIASVASAIRVGEAGFPGGAGCTHVSPAISVRLGSILNAVGAAVAANAEGVAKQAVSAGGACRQVATSP